jgi:hypothetical protein
MQEQKVMYNEIVDRDLNETDYASFTICLNYNEWQNLKKKIDKEFSGGLWDYSEVRISGEHNAEIIEVEGHCCLDRRRKRIIYKRKRRETSSRRIKR